MKKQVRTWLQTSIVAASLASSSAWAVDPSMGVQLVPSTIVGNRASTLVITINAEDVPLDAVVAIEPPPGFIVTTVEGENTGRIHVVGRMVLRAQMQVDVAQSRQEEGERPLVVTVTGSSAVTPSAVDGGAPSQASGTSRPVRLAHVQTFGYRPRISTVNYLWLGELGVLLGWIVRAVNGVYSVSSNERTALLNEKIKTSAKVALDLLFTAALGLIVLAQVGGSAAPDSSTTWYGAMSVGVGLGLLANAQLISKFPR